MKRMNLINARKLKGMTQRTVSNELSITITHYANIENCKYDGGVRLWLEMSKMFDKPIEYLMKEYQPNTKGSA